MKKIKDYLSLAVAIIAILGWLRSEVTNRVSDKKDAEAMQKSLTEFKTEMEEFNKGSIAAGKERAAILQYMKDHGVLHESLH